MEIQRKKAVGTSSPAPTPPQPKMLHNFPLPADLKWYRNTSCANVSRSRRQGESPSSSVSAQMQRPLAPQQSLVLKHMLGQNSLAVSGASASGSSSRYPSPRMVSHKGSSVVDVLSSGFMLDQNKEENEEHESVRTERFSITLPSPEKMIDQFKEGLTISRKQGREEKKVKKVNIRKKKPKSVKVDEETLPKMDDKELPDELSSKYYQGEDEDRQVIIGEFGESGGVPWNLRPRKPNQRPKVLHPCEALGSSSKLGGKSVAQRRSKMPEAIGNNNSDMKKVKGKDKRGKEKREKEKDKGREKSNNVPIMPNFRLTLTPEEIAEDLFAMTEREPSRKFKKRDKTVQETLDQVFPGMQLKDITPNDYKTSDNPRKGD